MRWTLCCAVIKIQQEEITGYTFLFIFAVFSLPVIWVMAFLYTCIMFYIHVVHYVKSFFNKHILTSLEISPIVSGHGCQWCVLPRPWKVPVLPCYWWHSECRQRAGQAVKHSSVFITTGLDLKTHAVGFPLTSSLSVKSV